MSNSVLLCSIAFDNILTHIVAGVHGTDSNTNSAEFASIGLLIGAVVVSPVVFGWHAQHGNQNCK